MAALGDPVCSFCKKNALRSSSSLIDDLPRRDQGGLFYGVEPDPDYAGHNKTFLKLTTEKPTYLQRGKRKLLKSMETSNNSLTAAASLTTAAAIKSAKEASGDSGSRGRTPTTSVRN